MITLEQIERIHAILIKNFGGAEGTRDIGAIEAALSRPYQTFDSQELYTEPTQKAAAIFESIIINHPFVDGNKRTAYVALRLTLLQYNCDIEASEDSKYDFVIRAAAGQLRFDEIENWIRVHIKQIY